MPPPAGADFCFCHFCLLGPNADGTPLGYKALSHLRLAKDMQEFSVILHLFFLPLYHLYVFSTCVPSYFVLCVAFMIMLIGWMFP